MSKLGLNTNDVRLLKHWLWVNVKCVAMLMAFIAVMRYSPDVPAHSLESVTFAARPTQGEGQSRSERMVLAASPPASAIEGRRPNPIPPTGWRRTNRGWEHTATWPSSSSLSQQNSISELIAIQESREPKWLQSLLGRVSRIPPLMIAVLQITIIALILTMAQSRVRV
ncbi:hypothetical protein Pla52o_30700 [Novipirellula galeiformis]|uniref:Uncharacterized protein n=1 Tax=Novipirellula galeiformis TaxID=2528004 RepID=A0A5C6CD10_9BACT|nr:hypothetical protein [Novipirellula galeiformis]TWU22022.1 hypothetical protein Pla52o_30700 [Novipirellula galeiformis]